MFYGPYRLIIVCLGGAYGNYNAISTDRSVNDETAAPASGAMPIFIAKISARKKIQT